MAEHIASIKYCGEKLQEYLLSSQCLLVVREVRQSPASLQPRHDSCFCPSIATVRSLQLRLGPDKNVDSGAIRRRRGRAGRREINPSLNSVPRSQIFARSCSSQSTRHRSDVIRLVRRGSNSMLGRSARGLTTFPLWNPYLASLAG